jgi:hypothetical protein
MLAYVAGHDKGKGKKEDGKLACMWPVYIESQLH